MLAREVRLRWRACTLRLLVLCLAFVFCTHFMAELRRKSWPQDDLLLKVPPREPGIFIDGHKEVPSKRQVIYVRRSSRGGSSGRPAGNSYVPRKDVLKPVRWHIDLQPWAGPTHSLNEEATRFLKYISQPQIVCSRLVTNGLTEKSEDSMKPWTVCLDSKFSLAYQIKNKQCRVYSLGLGDDDSIFEVNMASGGCEVHRFDPSIGSAHIHERERLWHHRLSVDWRDPNPAIAAHRLHSNTKKLGAILNEFGHWKIDILKADMESAEWKILENVILEG